MRGNPASKPLKVSAGYKPTRVLYFTDAHDRVDLPQDRFAWLGKLIADEEPDLVVCGGDLADFDSVNTHARNETYEGKLKPAFAKDLASLNNALTLIKSGHSLKIPFHITLGNHEHRIKRFENANPEMFGILDYAFRDILTEHGWRITNFKHYLNIDGVEFTHAPINAMGREIGGKNAASNVASNSLFDIVYGHTHKREEFVAAKLGPDNRAVRAYNGGCFLPADYRMDYAQCSMNRWDYGCSVIEIWRGRIHSISWISMEELETYG